MLTKGLMKKKHHLLRLFMILMPACIFSVNQVEISSERAKKNPGVYLNSQDVPLFYVGNPLEGLTSFAVIPPLCTQNPETKKKIQAIIEKELGVVGIVIKTNDEDMTGFGTGTRLNIQIGKVSKWDGGELPISRITLNIETPVVISKTNVKSSPRVWTINDFIDAPLSESEDKLIGAMQKLLKEFVKTYKFTNSDQKQKPTFYLYD